MGWRTLAAALVFGAAVQWADAAVGDRVALVIGNGQYASAPLANSVNDSRAVAQSLREMGFHVIERENLGARQIPATLREFRSSLTPGSVALFFYAGHGLQIKGVNYLPAVDADINSEDDVPMQSIDVNRVLDILADSKTRLNLLFLDACRNNPYARSMRSGVSGLAKVDAPSGNPHLVRHAARQHRLRRRERARRVHRAAAHGDAPAERAGRAGAEARRREREARHARRAGTVDGRQHRGRLLFPRRRPRRRWPSGPIDPLALEARRSGTA
jgi:hypothetical protein